MAVRGRPGRETIVGRVRAADPFELIRWLARSQPDPRKALAELVQNSIDAGARQIEITRLRERGVPTLKVRDDGEGVIPDLDRVGALTYVATHIGHSRKQNLTPEQRRELLVQGKYGIGLLGFWAIGELLEMRTHVVGTPPFVLRLHEDSPRYEIDPLRTRLALGERYTEVVVPAVHRPAWSSLTARRMADYLAVELRGQLLAREFRIVIHDRVARGRAQKVLEVRPARFSGERLPLPEQVPVPGHAPIRIELYLVPSSSAESGRIAVSSGGTTVYDDVTAFEVADLRRPPWNDARLTGLIEFPDFQVPPGSRRGAMPDAAALAFASALVTLEPALVERLREAEGRAAAEVGADLLRQLERAFRDVPRLAPEYDFFAVRAPGSAAFGNPAPVAAGANGTSTAGGADGAGVPATPTVDDEEDTDAPTLLPAGPLGALAILPSETRVERLGERRLRAEARDAAGTRIRRDLDVRWSCTPELGRLEPPEGTRTQFHAGPEPGEVTIAAEATEAGRTARAEARISIVETLPSTESPRTGIPEPAFVDEPAAPWRSRIREGAWEVNAGHPDFRSAAETARRKLRYLASLLAKEVVLHSFPSPQLGPALERLVEVMTIAERRLERA